LTFLPGLDNLKSQDNNLLNNYEGFRMVVTCEECHTKFLLDESRLKGPVTKARCSRCGHVFVVEKAGEREEGIPPESEVDDAIPFLEPPDKEAPSQPPEKREEESPPERAEVEREPEPQVKPSAPFPKPSILFPPAKRSNWPRIAYISGGILVVLLACGLALWFWGKPLIAKLKLKGKTPAPVQAPKTPAPSAVEAVVPPAPPPGAAMDLKDLEIFNQEERYRGLVNQKGGQLLLIQGKVKNSSNKPRGPIQIKATLTDSQHKTVKERDFYAGTVIFDDELQKLDPEEINRWFDTPGGRAQKTILEPGESQSFMVVFFGTPQSLAGYGYKMQVIKGAEAPGKSSRP
jgi:predicted Zn finger-like uncharacterized protein